MTAYVLCSEESFEASVSIFACHISTRIVFDILIFSEKSEVDGHDFDLDSTTSLIQIAIVAHIYREN